MDRVVERTSGLSRPARLGLAAAAGVLLLGVAPRARGAPLVEGGPHGPARLAADRHGRARRPRARRLRAGTHRRGPPPDALRARRRDRRAQGPGGRDREEGPAPRARREPRAHEPAPAGALGAPLDAVGPRPPEDPRAPVRREERAGDRRPRGEAQRRRAAHGPGRADVQGRPPQQDGLREGEGRPQDRPVRAPERAGRGRPRQGDRRVRHPGQGGARAPPGRRRGRALAAGRRARDRRAVRRRRRVRRRPGPRLRARERARPHGREPRARTRSRSPCRRTTPSTSSPGTGAKIVYEGKEYPGRITAISPEVKDSQVQGDRRLRGGGALGPAAEPARQRAAPLRDEDGRPQAPARPVPRERRRAARRGSWTPPASRRAARSRPAP